jgi:CheY-like chemotaxis protein
MNGIEVLRRIKASENTRHIAVIMLTNSSRNRDIAECRRLGAEGYIVKPVGFQNFSEATPPLRLEWALMKPSRGGARGTEGHESKTADGHSRTNITDENLAWQIAQGRHADEIFRLIVEAAPNAIVLAIQLPVVACRHAQVGHLLGLCPRARIARCEILPRRFGRPVVGEDHVAPDRARLHILLGCLCRQIYPKEHELGLSIQRRIPVVNLENIGRFKRVEFPEQSAADLLTLDCSTSAEDDGASVLGDPLRVFDEFAQIGFSSRCTGSGGWCCLEAAHAARCRGCRGPADHLQFRLDFFGQIKLPSLSDLPKESVQNVLVAAIDRLRRGCESFFAIRARLLEFAFISRLRTQLRIENGSSQNRGEDEESFHGFSGGDSMNNVQYQTTQLGTEGAVPRDSLSEFEKALLRSRHGPRRLAARPWKTRENRHTSPPSDRISPPSAV